MRLLSYISPSQLDSKKRDVYTVEYMTARYVVPGHTGAEISELVDMHCNFHSIVCSCYCPLCLCYRVLTSFGMLME